MVTIDTRAQLASMFPADEISPCPFCGEQFVKPPKPVTPIVFHPGVITDGDCALSGMGFREHQFALLNMRYTRDTFGGIE